MTNDRFWKSFWILSAGTTLLCLVASAALFFTHIGRIDTAAVGASFDPLQDPFKISLRQNSAASGPISITDGAIFKESLATGISTWNWSARFEMRSSEQASEGKYSLKATFNKDWAGIGIGGFVLDNTYKTLSLAVYPDAKVGDLFVELYDKKGTSLGRQSLGFYTEAGALAPGQWQTISIPVQNLIGPSAPAAFSAVSISTTNPGIAYIDSIQFNNTAVEHAAWAYKAPEGPGGNAYSPPPFNPFATSTAVALPYTLARSPNWDDRWYAFRGYFSQDYDAWRVGPKPGEMDGLTVFRGGLAWDDYRVSLQVSWGAAAVLALVGRMQDENNYVSCSYTGQGDYIQMYAVKDGVSTYVMESPKQHFYAYKGGVGQLGLIVKGNTLSCTMDGKTIISKQLPDMAPRGTIGFESWDQNDKNGPHMIEALTVQRLVGE